VVADIHFSSQLVIAAIEAGCGGVRVNPGNIRNFEKVARDLISAARSHGVSLRIGVNAGSLDPEILAKYQAKTAQIRVTADMLVESALKEARLFEQFDFYDFKISLKHHDPLIVIEAYRKLAELGDWPLHLGVTEAGLKDVGIIKSVSALSVLLSEGIGDTIRISLTDDPIEEVKAGTKLLEVLGLRTKTLDIVSCPTCARTNLNVIELTKRVEAALKGVKAPLTVAVMGCEVNGPGEAREADVGIAAGNGIGHLFVKGQIVKSVPEAEIVEVLVAEVQKLAESK
jgi:(E)-4-hydroxy-3-methylbut-2-enyl-diphosphate synthase